MRTMKNLKEQLMHAVFLLSACVSILCVAMICVFLFANGIPAIGKIGVLNFLTGEKWKPGNNLFGILPMILGSIYVTAGAVIIGVPIGILTAGGASLLAGRAGRLLCTALRLLRLPCWLWLFWAGRALRAFRSARCSVRGSLRSVRCSARAG